MPTASRLARRLTPITVSATRTTKSGPTYGGDEAVGTLFSSIPAFLGPASLEWQQVAASRDEKVTHSIAFLRVIDLRLGDVLIDASNKRYVVRFLELLTSRQQTVAIVEA